LTVFADVLEAENALAEFGKQLGHEQVSRAMRMAINDTMRKQRTKLRQYVRHAYNIPAEKVNTINFQPAKDFNLESRMSASRRPVQLAYFKPVFVGTSFSIRGSFTKAAGLKSKVGKGRTNGAGGVSVEIKKGQRVSILFAFMVGKFETPFVFARGQYQKGKVFVRSKPRNPINVLSSVSTYGAAFGSDRLPQIEKDAYVELTKKAVEYLQKMKEGIIS